MLLRVWIASFHRLDRLIVVVVRLVVDIVEPITQVSTGANPRTQCYGYSLSVKVVWV
jgi:hypothetical protein